MPTLTPNKLMTADEFLALGPDFHGELVKGRVVEMAPASWGHGNVALTIGSLLHVFVKEKQLGQTFAAETGFMVRRDPDTVRAPDVAFVATERMVDRDDRSGFFDGAPDLAVEVLSPSNTVAEMTEKIDDYFVGGCKAVWLVHPERRTVTVYGHASRPVLLRETELLTAPELLPGFSIEVSKLFE